MRAIWMSVCGAVSTALAVNSSAGCRVFEESAIQQGIAIDESVSRSSEALPLSIAKQNAILTGYYCEGGDLILGHTPESSNIEIAELEGLVQGAGLSFYCHSRQFPNHDPQILAITQPYSFLQLRSWRDQIVGDFFKSGGAEGLELTTSTTSSCSPF